MPRTISQLAQEAIDVQNACNPLGISKGYATALQELADNLRQQGLPSDTKAICEHPINKLWVSKIHDLAGMGISDATNGHLEYYYGQAYDACQLLAR
jgi:hypothetical protein